MLTKPASLVPLRRRGAQPGNNNARTHGFYAARDPSRLAVEFEQVRLIRQAVHLSLELHQLSLAERFVESLQEMLIESFLACDDVSAGPDTHLKFDRFFRTVSAAQRAKRSLKKLRDEIDFLSSLARDALHLATLEFTDTRISHFACYTANSYPPGEPFVPQLLRKNRGITPGESEASPPPPFRPFFSLTSAQWSLVEPIVTSLRARLASMAIRVRDPGYPDRFLLECILTRLTFRLRWSDMERDIPVRACQTLYKFLCTSGSMRAIYEMLHGHLQISGSTSLEAMARDVIFEHDDDHIWLAGPYEPTWEQLTGLLLMQRALFNRRRLKRAQDRDRRRSGRFEREPRVRHHFSRSSP